MPAISAATTKMIISLESITALGTRAQIQGSAEIKRVAAIGLSRQCRESIFHFRAGGPFLPDGLPPILHLPAVAPITPQNSVNNNWF